MSAKTLISASEYLHTPFENPEPDFVDGEIIPRAMPNNFHSEAVFALIAMFIRLAPTSLFPRPELRLRIPPDRYRVVDLAVFDHKPIGAIPETAPLIAIEVLSPDDSHAELMRKLADYAALGVPNIWLVDPIARRFSIYHDGSLTATPRLEVPAHGVVISLPEIFGT